jgi:Preprotein translocase subunit SecA (ATPase, RNA helicase)
MLQKPGRERRRGNPAPWINKAIEKAQKRVEGHYFEARKNILKYDNVMK